MEPKSVDSNLGVTSSKELWTHISGISQLKSSELVRSILMENLEWIKGGTRYYTRCDDDASRFSSDTPVWGKCSGFLTSLANLLGLKEPRAYRVFCSFLLRGYRGTQSQLRDYFTNRTSMHALLVQVWRHHREDRLYILVCLKHIITQFQEKDHPYLNLYEEFFETANCPGGSLIQNVVEQLEDLISDSSSVKASNFRSIADDIAKEEFLFNLKEQLELLQIIFLYYRDIEISGEEFFKLLTLFTRHQFGKRQSLKPKDVTSKSIIEIIGYLEVLIVLECLELQLLFECHSREIDEHYLFSNPEIATRINASIQSLGSHPEHGPIFLAWMMTWHLLKKGHQPNLSVKARKLGIFRYLVRALTCSLCIEEDSQVGISAHYIVYGFLLILMSEYEPSTFIEEEQFYKLIEVVLGKDPNAIDFWKSGLECGIGVLLQQNISWFPLKLTRLLRLLTPLTKASGKSCRNVISLLTNIPNYSESISKNKCENIKRTDRGFVIAEKERCLDEGLIISQKTEGFILHEEEDAIIVQWKTCIDGWKFCFSDVNSALLNKCKEGATGEQEYTLEGVTEFISAILQKEAGSFAYLRKFIFQALSMMPRFAIRPDPCTSLIASCIKVARSMEAGQLNEMWHDLTADDFFPFLTSKPKSPADASLSIGVVGHLIAGTECVTGSYRICAEFLDFILKALAEVGDEDLVLQGSLLYILKEIFSSIFKFKYQSEAERIKLGGKCLEIFQRVLANKPEPSSMRQICLHWLHFSDAGRVLMQIVCTGEENLDPLYGRHNIHLVWLSLSVLDKLLDPKPENSPLKEMLVTQKEIILIIAFYSFQGHCAQLATISIQLLERFAKEFPLSILAYFGDKAEVIRDHFLFRLCSVTEDNRLKVSILKFLTACVPKQPGVIHLFINRPIVGKETFELSNCLYMLMEILKEKKEGKYYCPDDLYYATVEFIHALWAGSQMLGLQTLKDQSSFWSLFTHFLREPHIYDVKPRAVSYIVETLSLELYYSRSFRERLDPLLRYFLEVDSDKNCLFVISKYVKSQCVLTARQDRSKITLEEKEGFRKLLVAWRTLLIIWFKFPTVKPSLATYEFSISVLDNVFSCLFILEKCAEDCYRTILAETCLVLVNILKGALSPNQKLWMASVTDLVVKMTTDLSNCPPSFVVKVVSIANRVAKYAARDEQVIESSREWFRPLMKVYEWALPPLMAWLTTNARCSWDFKMLPLEFVLPTICLVTLNQLIIDHTSSTDWVNPFKEHCTYTSLTNILQLLLSLKKENDLSQTIISLLISSAENAAAAKMIVSTGIISKAIVIIDDKDCDATLNGNCSTTFHFLVRLVTSLLKSEGIYFFNEALLFVTAYSQTLRKVLSAPVESFTPLKMEKIQSACVLFYQMSDHEQLWRAQNSHSLDVVLYHLGGLVNNLVYLLMRPSFQQGSAPTSPKKQGDSPHSSSRSKAKPEATCAPELACTPEETKAALQNAALKALATCWGIFGRASPFVGVSIGTFLLPSHGILPLSPSFSPPPAAGSNQPLRFGTILCCISVCLRILDRAQLSENFTYYPRDGVLALNIVERCLCLALSQSIVILENLPARERGAFWRDFETEMNSISLMVLRFFKKGANLIPSQEEEEPFAKTICTFIQNLINTSS